MFKIIVAFSVLSSLNYCSAGEILKQVEPIPPQHHEGELIHFLQHQFEVMHSAVENLKLRLEILNGRFDHQTTLLNEMNKKICTIEDNTKHLHEAGEKHLFLAGHSHESGEKHIDPHHGSHSSQIFGDKHIDPHHGSHASLISGEKHINPHHGSLSPQIFGDKIIDLRHDSHSSKISGDKHIDVLHNTHSPKISDISEKFPRNCYESHLAKHKSGLQSIYLANFIPSVVIVYCDNERHGGGWTVIQRRVDGSMDFHRDWSEYKHGFGHLEGEFWIGLDKLHALTTSAPHELIIIMEDFENKQVYAKYDHFTIGDESEGYVLKTLGKYTGDAGDSFTSHLSAKFTTKDVDHDLDNGNCAVKYVGAWWYNKCHFSNLNGKYLGGEYGQQKFAQGVVWQSYRGYNYSLKFVQMMIRPTNY